MAEEKHSRAAHTLSHGKSDSKKKKKSKGKKHKVVEIHIRPSDDGQGYIARHDYAPEMGDSGMMESPKQGEYAISDHDQLHDHMDEYPMHDDSDAEDAAAEPSDAEPSGSAGTPTVQDI